MADVQTSPRQTAYGACTFIASLALTATLSAQVPQVLRVLGAASAQLTPADVTTIQRVTTAAGVSPWFVAWVDNRGIARTIGGEPAWTASVFLAADVATPQLRRGRTVSLISPIRSQRPDSFLWSIDSRQQPSRWAQVAVPGRAFDDVRNREDDENQPFMVLADIPDDDLIGLVSFVRSRQSFPVASGNQPAAYGAIASVGLLPSPGDPPLAIRVGVRVPPSPGTFAELLVERRGIEWTGTFTGFGYGDRVR